MGTTSSITIQSLGKIVQRAAAVGAKTWCLYVCFLSRSEAGALFVRGVHTVRTSIALLFIGRFRRGFQIVFFHKGLLFQVHYIVLSFVGWRHKFREVAVKNCEKSKNRRKSLCAPLRIDS